MELNVIFSELEKIQSEQKKIKEITLLSAKQALTMNDAALLTGLSKSYLYKLVCEKKIPYYKSQGGKMTYFEKSELNDWMLKNRMQTTDEIEQEAMTYVITGKKKGGKNV